MLITLITPPSAFLLDERVFASLGVLKVGAALIAGGYEVEHLDLSGVANYLEVVKQHQGQVYAITATTPQMPAASAIGAALKIKGAKTVLGGAHVTLTHAALRWSSRANIAWRLLQQAFDVLVAGDGERAVFEALTFEQPVVNADDVKSPLWLDHQAFEESPWPNRRLIDLSTYHYKVDGEPAYSLISQLGCPFGCAFCAGRDSSMLRRIRNRSPENVLAEMLSVYRYYGMKGAMFLDDELNVNRQMLPLMRMLHDTGVDWRLRGFIKAELFTPEQAEAMYTAGFRQLLIGFESGDDRILTNIQKRATRSDNTRAVETAHAAGLKVKALMSLGHAGETEATVQATKDWLLEVAPDDFDATIITPYPGSPYYDRAVRHGDVWVYTAANGDRLQMADVDFTTTAQYYKGAPGSYVSYVWTDDVDRERLTKLRDDLEADVREALGIPFYPAAASVRYEASMGQLPGAVLRRIDGA